MKLPLAALLAIALALSAPLVAATTIFVDDDAPSDPGPGDPSVSDPLEDGTSAHPFDAIQEGIDGAVDTDTVLVLDGTYTGTGNRAIKVPRRGLTVQSENGPASTVVDAEYAAAGFVFEPQPDPGTNSSLEGFTIQQVSGPGVSSFVSDGTILVRDCIMSDGQTTGIFTTWSNVLLIEDCTIENNGGNGVEAENLTISGCTITGNGGSGIHAQADAITISDCHIEDNADSGVWVGSTNPIAVSGCTIVGNTNDQGGGIRCDGGALVVTDSTIADNHAEGAAGGGIRCYGGAPLEMTGCTLTGNTAQGWGGGLFSNSTVVIVDSIVTANESLGTDPLVCFGGGICTCFGGHLEIRRSVISGNRAGRGGGIACETAAVENCIIAGNEALEVAAIDCDDDLVMTNCTLTENPVDDGAAVSSTTATLTNCILWRNGPKQLEADTITAAYCCVEDGSLLGWYDPATCIDVDPQLDGDHHLSATSPCIDWCPTGPADDVDGEPRPVDVAGVGFDDPPDARTYDIGADERLDTDGDGLPDYWENKHYGDAAGDPDTDGLDNLGEYEHGTDPDNPDTDDDGRTDGEEVTAGTNPAHPDNAEKTYYVNGASGNNTWDGLAPSYDGAHGPKATIQAGIDATLDGWSYIVLVADGTYTGDANRDLSFRGKAITVRSENGPENCIIDCEGLDIDRHRGFVFHFGESEESILSGLSITNAFSPEYGGAILCSDMSSPTIADCTLYDNVAKGGGGIYCFSDSHPTIIDCTIRSNWAAVGGGGVFCEAGSNPTITNCVVEGNDAAEGGGIDCWDHCNPTVTNCTIRGNSAIVFGGGFRCSTDGNPTMTNCILWGNSAPAGHEIALDARSHLTVRYCVVQGGAAEADVDSSSTLDLDGTNIDADPMLTADARLTLHSPCIDWCPTGPALDIDGQARPVDVLLTGFDGERLYDIGADELNDADADDMDDDWEVANGLDPSDPTDATLDADGDWLLNEEEYRFGSDPQDPDSPAFVYVDHHNAGDPAQDGTAAHPYEAIQRAIDAATPPAVVKVLPGDYTENVVMANGVWVVAYGPTQTTIDAGWVGEGVYIEDIGEVLLAGFTVAWGDDYNAIRIVRSSPTIRNCRITVSKHGAGCAESGSPVFINCVFTGNFNVGYWQTGTASATFTNCVIARNQSYGIVPWSGTITMTNTIVYGNGDDLGGEPAAFAVAYCDIGDGDFAGTNGNISANPMFFNFSCANYRLLPNSPCIDAGTSDGAPSLDILGDARWDKPDTPNTGGGALTFYDMGAYEHAQTYIFKEYFVNGATGDDTWDGLTPDWEGGRHGPKRTIQSALYAASSGDTLTVAPYTYTGDGNRDLGTGGKTLVVRSSGGPDVTIIDCGGSEEDEHGGFSLDGWTVMDGFTITNGYKTGGGSGGAICCSGSPTIRNCILVGNTAGLGGAFHSHGGSPVLHDVTISGNYAVYSGGGCSMHGGQLTVDRCTITGNESPTQGGGIYAQGEAFITNCVIADNTGGWDGGGAIAVFGDESDVTMHNCTLVGNSASGPGDGINVDYDGTLALRNCIVWGNSTENVRLGSGTLTINYSDVEGGWPDWSTIGNIDADPMFVDAAGGDYHLGPISPCIDAGDPVSDYSNEPLPNGGRINMGAYGNTAEATCTPGDIDGDGEITLDDLVLVYDGLGTDDPALDINGDGLVTFADLRIVYEHIPEGERDLGGVSTMWAIGYMEPTDPAAQGLDPTENQSQLDNDGDDRTNYEEYVAGTDPTDPASRFEVTAVACDVAFDMETVTVSWSAVPGKSYQLYCAELPGDAAPWQPVDGIYEINGAIATQTVAVDPNAKRLFFKVEVW